MLFKQFKKYARSKLATFPLLWAAFCVTSTLAGWRRVQPPGPIHLWQRRCRHNHDWDEVRDQLCLKKTCNLTKLTLTFQCYSCWAPYHFVFKAKSRCFQVSKKLWKSATSLSSYNLLSRLSRLFQLCLCAEVICHLLFSFCLYQRRENLGDHLDLTFLPPLPENALR